MASKKCASEEGPSQGYNCCSKGCSPRPQSSDSRVAARIGPSVRLFRPLTDQATTAAASAATDGRFRTRSAVAACADSWDTLAPGEPKWRLDKQQRG